MWDVKIGDKIACIKTSQTKQQLILPVVGHVYTVDEFRQSSFDPSEILLKLEEIPDQEGISYRTGRPAIISWPKEWFRPVNNIDKGMEKLRWALNNPTAKISGFEQLKKRRKARV